MNALTLTPFEARVLGTLMEKARTVPDSYPLSLNALLLGCNQKTSREPVLNLTDQEVLLALQTLKRLHLVIESSSSRVARYAHNFQRITGLAEAPSVLVGLLLLRGPQTAAELRANAERWYRFADAAAVELALQDLQQQPAAFVALLPRLPGAREARWAHVLCGTPDLAALAAQTEPPSAESAAATTGHSALQERIDRLEARIAALESAWAA
jgi:uncharacterized protein